MSHNTAMRWLMVPLLLLPLVLLGCGDDSGKKNTGETIVTIMDKGAVVPNSISTTGRINSNIIHYSQEQSGQTTNEWTASIQTGDYASVRQVIAEHNLMECPDVGLPAGLNPCIGWKGLTITLEKEKIAHVINIDAAACSTYWPEGIQKLVSIQDNLVLKYQP